MEFTKEQMSKALDEAYKKAGHNAYFANGFEAGVKYAQEQFKILNIPVVVGRSEQLKTFCEDCLQDVKDSEQVILCKSCWNTKKRL